MYSLTQTSQQACGASPGFHSPSPVMGAEPEGPCTSQVTQPVTGFRRRWLSPPRALAHTLNLPQGKELETFWLPMKMQGQEHEEQIFWSLCALVRMAAGVMTGPVTVTSAACGPLAQLVCHWPAESSCRH